ncbi:MAG TPA: helix-turn-helix domain-containing protein [Mycobacteriales bacterium]|nr:helix-turn-helix domain-containing protein [Mycobacteriales bacterium]
MRSKDANVVAAPPRTLAILVFDDLSTFEFGIAHAVFGHRCEDHRGPTWYDAVVCAAQRGPVTTDAGLVLHVPNGLRALERADTIVVLPTEPVREAPEAVLRALRRAHERGVRLVSLCSAAFTLAEAGLLDGRRVTTHWAECEQLKRSFPRLDVDPKVLYTDDGDILTSAGSAAGIDLCLSVVRQDFGAEVASHIARDLVVPPHREGGQAQYIEAPMPRPHLDDPFQQTLAWMEANLDQQVTIDDLARRSAMSRRTFIRRFTATVGVTPYQWLLRRRLHFAQRLLETTDLTVDSVAERSGFVSAVNLRKHFSRVLHTSPHAYRRTFAA